MECRICGVSCKKTPLTAYANEDFSKWLYLCKDCHERLIAKTGGVIPVNLGDADEQGGNNWMLAKRRMDLSRIACVVLER